MTFEAFQTAFEERQRIAHEYLRGMQATKATALPAADKAEMIRILARAAHRALAEGK